MKVVLINHSDTQGGAAVVSLRLIHALEKAGVQARMLVTEQSLAHDERVATLGHRHANKARFIAERLHIMLHNGAKRESLFKIDTCQFGADAAAHPWVKEADVVVLAWVNQGTLSLSGIEALHRAGKPIIWVMHDMWNCTGVCHHAFDCEGYLGTCRACHLLGKHADDLSTTTQRRKARLYSRAPITFVAVSHWLEGVCRKSAIMKDCDVRMIFNAFPAGDYQWERLTTPYPGVPHDKTVIIMGARRLDEDNKGFPEMLETTQYIAQHRPALAQKIHFLLYGDIKDASLLEQMAVPYTYVGPVNNAQLNDLYRHSDIVLSTSLYENLPGTLIEGQASGCLPVTFGKGGQADIVDHLRSGYIADYKSPSSIADGIAWAIDNPANRHWLHQEVERKFSAEVIAQQFIELFREKLEIRS
ncbi:MAG: glycosyltransferase, partial [Bacteroidales bacterium]|nr:glycosyltransferase [Bacteroidales bacterium]